MHKKAYDTAKILYLYEKYGTLNGVTMRTGYGVSAVKRILLENGVELNKYIPPRWNYNQIRY